MSKHETAVELKPCPAEQWHMSSDPETWPECVQWDAKTGAYAVTVNGSPQRLKDGDWIVKDKNGKYSVTSEIDD